MSKDVYLSASRIKTAQSCSWKYWTSYVLKLPQEGNDGSSRGWICHLVFELLGEKKHNKHYKSIIKSGTIMSSPAVFRLVNYHAKKLKVNDEENMEMMDSMIIKGLLYDFFGKNSSKPSNSISEQEFNFHIQDGSKNYKIRGFIDKLFLYNRKSKALIRDFKTSKQVFKGKEITDNLQNLMYCLAVKKLFPKVQEIDVEFLFLKFDLSHDLLGNPGNGILKMSRISASELDGFEHQLTAIQSYLENFSEQDACSNFAADQPYPADKTFGGPLMCGREGFKKSKGEYVLDNNGEKIKSYICEHRLPMKYFHVLNKDGDFVASTKIKNKSDYPDDYIFVEKFYQGCPHFFEKASFLV